jgi:hypothetical protein
MTARDPMADLSRHQEELAGWFLNERKHSDCPYTEEEDVVDEWGYCYACHEEHTMEVEA